MGTQKLPELSGRKVIKALKKDGFQNHSQKGGHVKLKKTLDDGKVLTVIVPAHGKIGKKLLKTIINQAGLNNRLFLELL
ncbi:MAG: type II toxin-antitoxin system HicA family toxin [Lutibacter sp.]|jgi:predicted RNA binding protein YcfA (HicA-like mRNA interferase family)